MASKMTNFHSHAKMIQYMNNLCAKKNFAMYLSRKVMDFQKKHT